MAQHNKLGKKGEKLAMDYLLKKGYEIIEKNYRFKKAEIDIIVKKENTLVVVEVKTRSNIYYGEPQTFVGSKKIKLLSSAINNYVIEKDLETQVRFDIIAIIKTKNNYIIEHLKDAFLYF